MNLNELPDMSSAYKQVLEGKKSSNDGNLANNAVPYDKVTKADIIVGAVGRDEKGGKNKPKGHDCAKLVKYAPDGSVKEEFETIPEMHTMLEDGTVTHYDITNGKYIYENVPVEDLEILISEKHEHFVNYDKNAEVLGEVLTGDRYKAALKKGRMYSRKVSADPSKRATRGGRGGESDFGAGDRGSGNRAARRAGTYQEEGYAIDENRAAARAAGGYKDDSKKQPDPSKAGFTGIGNMSIAQIAKMSKEIEKKNRKEEFETDEFFMIEWVDEVIETLAESAEIDQLSDEDLANLFETAFLELSDGPDDLLEMVEIFEEVVMLDEAVDLPPALAAKRSAMKAKRDAAAAKKETRSASGAMQRADIKSRASRLKAAAGAAAEKVKSGLKSAADKVSKGASSVSKAMDSAKGKQSDSSSDDDDDKPKSSGGTHVVHAVPVVAVAGRAGGGGSSSGGGAKKSSSSSGETRKAVGGALRSVGRLIKKGVKKAVGKTARLVSRGSEKLAKRLGENYEQIEHMMESGLFTMSEIENVVCLDEKTAMAKRGHNETEIRNRIAANTGGGKSADRATALEKKPTYGNGKVAQQRSNLARKQRGDFRNTTSSSPGLHGYGHKSSDPDVQAKQAARGKQRGALTPQEKKDLGR